MKKFSFLSIINLPRIITFLLALLMFSDTVNAQVLAKWPLNSKAVPAPTPSALGTNATAVGVSTGVITYNSYTFGNTAPNTTGLRLKTINNLVWSSAPDPTVPPLYGGADFTLNFPISSATLDFTVTGISMDIASPTIATGVVLAVIPYYQIDGAGAWTPFGTAQTFSAAGNVNFGTLNQPFFLNGTKGTGHKYVIKLCFYTTTSAKTTKGDYFSLNNVIFNGTTQAATQPPLVTTSTAASTGKYTATSTGTYSFGAAFQNPLKAGVTWSTGANPDISTSPFTNNGAGGAINSTITGLSANTNYHVRAYVVTPLDTIYGQDLSFTTDNYTAPAVTTTNPVKSVFSNKAIVEGVIIDSGGLPITDKYIKYGTNKASLNNIARPTINTGSTPYSIVIKQLLPNTTYYYEACATNNNNGVTLTNCGSIESFTTSAAVPTLTANPNTIDFGDIVYNSTAPVISFTVSGDKFTSATGSITVNISPASGFILSTSPTNFPTVPVSSITIPYTNSTIKKAVPIYVKLLTSNYGNFSSIVSLSGGGVAPQDADSVFLTGNVISSPDQLSNMGTDFWTGFAYQNNMASVPTNSGAAQMSIYIAAGNTDADVTIELPGIAGAVGFPQSFKIPANTVKEITGFPIGTTDQYNSGNGPDSRLYYTGISKRGVHIMSTNGVPVAVWMHTYTTNNSAGATMVFPTNTWGASYSVQAYGGVTNSGKASSFFFVMAKEDNTDIEFTPSNDIVDSSKTTIFQEGNTVADVLYAKGKTYKITLNKGGIFNAMSFVQGTGGNVAVGLDLSGTTVKTVDCSKKIAVFAGSGRVLVATKTGLVDQGSDNLVQQMFPKVAWGTKYLTVPTKTMEYNVYRINVDDSTTKVWLNSPVHTAGTALPMSQYNSAGHYYPIEGNQPNIIESDKPISLTQFIIAGSAPDGVNNKSHPTIGNSGQGDPEMIILSPVQQAINAATVYSSNFKNGKTGGSYINVVIKNSGIASFKLDGKQTADTGVSSYSTIGVPGVYGPSANVNIPMSSIFKVHPGDPNYSYAKFRVSSGLSHSITSSVPFNAIAYGMVDGESYGYNAGTAINNLSSIKIIENPQGQDTSSSVIRTCKNNLVRLQIALPYPPSQVDNIVWSAPNNSNINLSGTSVNGPTMTDPNNPSKTYADTSGTVVVDGQTFYLYTCPVQYQFSDFGFYPIIATAHGTFASECSGTDAQKIYVQVTSDNIDFKAVPAGCGSTNVTFTDNSTAIPGASIVKWMWDFGDGKTETITNSSNPNPTTNPHVYPGLNTYTATLTTVSSIGCLSTDNVALDLGFGITAGFSKDQDTLCLNSTVSFTDTSSSTTGKPASWKWDFGEPTSGANNTSTLQNPQHTYSTSGKHVVTLQVFTAGGCASKLVTDSVYVSPVPKPSFTFGGVCLPGSTVFTNTSDTLTGNKPYTYSWNFGETTSGANNTSTATDGVHTYTAPVPNGGYTVKLTATNRFGCIDSISQMVATIYNKPTAIIVANAKSCFGDSTSFADASMATNQIINKWDWDFGDATNSTIQNPKHKYISVNSFTTKLTITTDKGCTSDTTVLVKINPLPVPGFLLPSSCLGSGTATFTNKATISDLSSLTTLWSYVKGGILTPSSLPNGDGQYTYSSADTFPVIQKVISSNGCSAADTLKFIIAGSKPRAGFTIINGNKLCGNLPVQIQDTSRIDIGVISKIQIIWDVVNNPSVIATYNKPAVDTIYSNKYSSLPNDAPYSVKLIATCGSSCADTSIVQVVNVHGTPTISFVASPANICASNPAIIINGATKTSGPNPPNGSSGFTYSGVGVIGNSFDPSKAVVGNNTIQATYTTSDGCKETASSIIKVLASVDLSFNPTSLKVCKKDSVQLVPISNTGIKFSWTESDAPNYTMSDSTARTPMVGPTADITTYTVIASNPAYCSATKSITVYASPYPQASIVNPIRNNRKDTTICFGSKLPLTVIASSPNITWTPKDSLASGNYLKTVIANPVDTTTYIVKVTDNGYCTKEVFDTVYVNVLPKLHVGIHVGRDTSTYVTPGDSLLMKAYILDTAFKESVKYTWSPNTYLDNSDTSSPVLLAHLPLPIPNYSTYRVSATTAQGCTADTSIEIRFFNTEPSILVPSAFSPNSSINMNRVLTPSPIGIIQFHFFRVYNRAGQLVFSTNKVGEGWDGTIYGVPADPGTYIWMADGIGFDKLPHPSKGFVVLFR